MAAPLTSMPTKLPLAGTAPWFASRVMDPTMVPMLAPGANAMLRVALKATLPPAVRIWAPEDKVIPDDGLLLTTPPTRILGVALKITFPMLTALVSSVALRLMVAAVIVTLPV